MTDLAEDRIAELDAELKIHKQFLEDCSDDLECLPECDPEPEYHESDIRSGEGHNITILEPPAQEKPE